MIGFEEYAIRMLFITHYSFDGPLCVRSVQKNKA